MEVGTIYTLFAECGRDLSAFPTAGDFASWLALRLAAQALHHSRSALGGYDRRMRYRLGPAKAITAATHKLARIIYHLVTTGQPYDETVLASDDQKTLAPKPRRLKAQATALGYTLVPVEASS